MSRCKLICLSGSKEGRKNKDSLNDGRLLLSSRPVVEHLPHPDGIETLRIDIDLVHLAIQNGQDRDDSRVGGALDEDVVSGSDEDVESFGKKVLEKLKRREGRVRFVAVGCKVVVKW